MNTVCEKIALHQSLKPAVLKQSEKEEEVLDDKSDSLPRADDFKPAVKSTDGADQYYIGV